MRTTTYSDLRSNLKHYLDGVVQDCEPLIVQRPDDGVVLISLSEYNALTETEYLMRSPAMVDAIEQGEKDAKEGRVIAQEEGESMEDFLNRVACTE